MGQLQAQQQQQQQQSVSVVQQQQQQQQPSLDVKPDVSQPLTNGGAGLDVKLEPVDAVENSPNKILLQESQETRTASPLALPNGNGQVLCFKGIEGGG
jgi:hypothetical protein